jgi:hypothetical protein
MDSKWQFCSDVVGDNYDTTYTTMLPIYQKLISAGLRVLVYSGDNDMAVNTLGTEESVNILQQATKANIIDEWRK